MFNPSLVISYLKKNKLLTVIYFVTILTIVISLLIFFNPQQNSRDSSIIAPTPDNVIFTSVIANIGEKQTSKTEFRGDVSKLLPEILVVTDNLGYEFQCKKTENTIVTLDEYEKSGNLFNNPPILKRSNEPVEFNKIKIGDAVTVNFRSKQKEGNECVVIKIFRFSDPESMK
ncbi:MAG TPA: hypothetical protein VJC17_01815 [Candidatus Dojkabacteria bacterium]|nr:hypothetical protein [Candidatus Dojkabacteria bacterium]